MRFMHRKTLAKIVAGYIVFGVAPNVTFYACNSYSLNEQSKEGLYSEKQRVIFKLDSERSARKIFNPYNLIPFSFLFTDEAPPYEEVEGKKVSLE